MATTEVTRFEHAVARRTVDFDDLRVDVPQAGLPCLDLNKRRTSSCQLVLLILLLLFRRIVDIWQLVWIHLDLVILFSLHSLRRLQLCVGASL